MLKTPLIVALVAVGLCAGSAAKAQIKAEHPRFCVMSVGPTQMMFSAFQENKTDEIFCQHVPDTGRTMIILDARQPELRDLTLEVRLLRDIGQTDWRDNLDSTQVAYLPPQKYLAQNGTTSFTHEFEKDGDYITIVRATNDDKSKDYVGIYKFTVGKTMLWYAGWALFAAVGVAASAALWRGWGKSSRPVSKYAAPTRSALR